jgi:Tol biopolymer transport system component
MLAMFEGNPDSPTQWRGRRGLGPPLRLLLACVATVSAACSQEYVKPHRPKLPWATNAQPSSSDPIWSPDGLFLYFNHRPLNRIYENPPGSGGYWYEFADSLAGFYRADVSGQNMRQLLPYGFGACTISKDGAWIYYEKGGQIWRIARVGDTLDVATAVQVTNSSQGAFSPSVSWSGTRLLYDVSGTGANPGIFITGVEGGPARLVGQTAWVQPDWGPRDSVFAFVGQGPIRGIAIVDTFGAGALELHSGSYPKWSPDGQHIAYLGRSSTNGGVIDQLWMMNRDGTGAQKLSIDGTIPGYNWGPSSHEIAYVRLNAGDTSYVNGTLWIVDTETLQKRQVTFNPDP